MRAIVSRPPGPVKRRGGCPNRVVAAFAYCACAMHSGTSLRGLFTSRPTGQVRAASLARGATACRVCPRWGRREESVAGRFSLVSPAARR